MELQLSEEKINELKKFSDEEKIKEINRLQTKINTNFDEMKKMENNDQMATQDYLDSLKTLLYDKNKKRYLQLLLSDKEWEKLSKQISNRYKKMENNLRI
jgi:rRNA maturation protein Rpf1